MLLCAQYKSSFFTCQIFRSFENNLLSLIPVKRISKCKGGVVKNTIGYIPQFFLYFSVSSNINMLYSLDLKPTNI
jgi:hypothetical protein